MTGPPIEQEPPLGTRVHRTGAEWARIDRQTIEGDRWTTDGAKWIPDGNSALAIGWDTLLGENEPVTLIEPPPGSILVSPDGSTWTHSPGGVNRNDWYRRSGDSLHFTDLPGPVTVLRLGPIPAASNPTVRSTKVTTTRSWRAGPWSVEATTDPTAKHPIEVTARWLSQAEAFEIAGALIAAADWTEDQLIYEEDSA